MRPVTVHQGVVAMLDRANVDTDQIIPKQFLKSIARTGFGESLFFDWRYLADGSPNPEFELNQSRFLNASILVTRNNFGCGSSREHAVWAVDQYGMRVIIAPRVERNGSTIPGFADIFRNNCMKNVLLTIELSEAEVEKIFQMMAKQTVAVEATVDLPKQVIRIHLPQEELKIRFEIDPGVKNYLVQGLDSIGLTLQNEAAISAFEKSHSPQL